jgi:hypothetical protein
MARIFTVNFNYQEQTFTAVISITESDGNSKVMIHLTDGSLHEILPGGSLSFDAHKGIPMENQDLTPAQDLLASVLAAVERYDQNVVPVLKMVASPRADAQK